MHRLIGWLVSPLGAATALAALAAFAWGVGLALRGRAPRRAAASFRWAVALVSVAMVGTIASSVPLAARALARPLEAQALELANAARGGPYDAIVVLGGAVQPPSHRPGAEVGLTDASDRVWHAARLWHRRVAPVIVASGGPPPRPGEDALHAEADAMRTLLESLGVPADAILVESRSANTRENARYTAELIGPGRRVALVTSAIHMPRALRDARAAGLEAAAFPTDFQVLDRDRPWFEQLAPDADALSLTGRVMKERVAEMAARFGALAGP